MKTRSQLQSVGRREVDQEKALLSACCLPAVCCLLLLRTPPSFRHRHNRLHTDALVNVHAHFAFLMQFRTVELLWAIGARAPARANQLRLKRLVAGLERRSGRLAVQTN